MKHSLCPLFLLTAACMLLFAGTPASALPANGRAAPSISAKDLVSGETVSLFDYRGKWVVLQFWSSWCDVCIEHLPQLKAIAARPAGDNVAVLSVSQDHEQAPMELYDMLSASPPNFPVLHAFDGEYAKDFGWDVEYVPTTAIIDPQGRVVYSSSGLEDIAGTLDFFRGLGELDGAYRLEVSSRLLEDGSLELTAEVESPQGLPLELAFSAWRSGPEDYAEGVEEEELPAIAEDSAGSAEGGDLATVEPSAAEADSAAAEEDADHLGETRSLDFSAGKVVRQSFTLPADYLGQAADVYYSMDFSIPGSDVLNEGFGILLDSSGTLYPGLDWDPEATAHSSDDEVLAAEEAALAEEEEAALAEQEAAADRAEEDSAAADESAGAQE